MSSQKVDGSNIVVHVNSNKRKAEPKILYDVLTRKDPRIPSLLYDLLSFATPPNKEEPCRKIIGSYLRRLKVPFVIDEKGNLHTAISKADGTKSKTLFSSHMDTMQHGIEPREINLITGPSDKDKDFIFASLKGKRSVLGADDKVGVYIMLQMIRAKIPGAYIFHMGEEAGCIGSNWLHTNKKEVLETFDRCIAFDRANYGDIIHTQRGRRCCSEEFVKDLAERLNAQIRATGYITEKTDKSYLFSGSIGVYTDSAVYTDIIPECTNISVGYFSQHTPSETFDLWWLTDVLLPSILKVDWDALVTKRDPKEVVSRYQYHNNNHYLNGYDNEYYGHWWAERNNDKNNDFGYNGLPAHLRMVEKWKPTDGYPTGAYTYERRMKVRKWTFKPRFKMEEDLIEFLDQVHIAEEAYIETLDNVATAISFISDLRDKMISGAQNQDIIEELDSISNVLEDCLEAPDPSGEDDEEEREELNDELPFQPAANSGNTNGISLRNPIFNQLTFKAYFNGEELHLYTKKHRKLRDTQKENLAIGTKLYVEKDQQLHLIHTVTGKEPFFKKAS